MEVGRGDRGKIANRGDGQCERGGGGRGEVEDVRRGKMGRWRRWDVGSAWGEEGGCKKEGCSSRKGK